MEVAERITIDAMHQTLQEQIGPAALPASERRDKRHHEGAFSSLLQQVCSIWVFGRLGQAHSARRFRLWPGLWPSQSPRPEILPIASYGQEGPQGPGFQNRQERIAKAWRGCRQPFGQDLVWPHGHGLFDVDCTLLQMRAFPAGSEQSCVRSPGRRGP